MKWSKFFMLFALVGAGVACSDDDSGKEDEKLDMDRVMNKDLYYNKWLNNKDAYTTEGMVEVIRFSGGGDNKLWNIDFGGKQETLLGTWKDNVEENVLNVTYQNGKQETWHVLDWKDGKFTVMVNGGKREYISEENKEAEYLQNLTGDAFLLTEIDQRESKTVLRIMLEGSNTPNIRAEAILSGEQVMELKYMNKTMVEKEPIDASLLGLPGRERDVIFYVKNAGKGKEFKFADHVYTDGLGAEDFSAFDLRSRNTSNEMTITWKNPYGTKETCYQIEVMSADEKEEYFVSDYLEQRTSQMKIDNTTKCMEGHTNNMRDLFSAEPGSVNFKIRLSIVLLEPGVDINSKCSYVNRQSVTKVSSIQAWN